MPTARKTAREDEEAPSKRQRTLTAEATAEYERKKAAATHPQAWERAGRRSNGQPDDAPLKAEDSEDDGSWATENDEDVDERFEDIEDDEIVEDEEAEEDNAADGDGDDVPEGEADAAAKPGARHIGELKNVRFAPEAEKMLQDSETNAPTADASKVWRGGSLSEGENLEYSNLAYDSFFRLRTEWPALSFDVLRDGEGDGRTKYPLSLMLVAGTQADASAKNEIVVLHISNVCRTKHDMEEEESEDSVLGDDEASEDDEDGEEVNNGEPIVDSKSIPHHGTVNRLRCNPAKSSVVLAWSDSGRVQVFDVDSEVRAMADFANWSKEQAAAWGKKGTLNPLRFTSSGSTHKVEGYGLDWSALQSNTFATGDCEGSLFVWKPADGGRWAPFSSGNATSSIEEVKWSPTQPDYLVTASAGGAVSVWDSRDLRSAKITWQADATDINVCDWCKVAESSHLLVTGAEGGLVAVWDLRDLQKKGSGIQPIQTLRFHEGVKVTSVEFSHHNGCVFAVCADDGQCTVWDLSLERDPDEEREALGDLFGRPDVSNLPDQLMFQHQGLEHPKEVHLHAQIPGLFVTTDYTGFHLFKPMNWRSLMK